jgi:maleylacetate reductase
LNPSSQNENLFLTLTSGDSLRLPHALAYNSPAAPEAIALIAAAIGASNAPIGLHRLAVGLGVPTPLRDLGVKESDLDRACEIALSNPYWSPRPIEAPPARSATARLGGSGTHALREAA